MIKKMLPILFNLEFLCYAMMHPFIRAFLPNPEWSHALVYLVYHYQGHQPDETYIWLLWWPPTIFCSMLYLFIAVSFAGNKGTTTITHHHQFWLLPDYAIFGNSFLDHTPQACDSLKSHYSVICDSWQPLTFFPMVLPLCKSDASLMFVRFKLAFSMRFYNCRSSISPINYLATFKDGTVKWFTNLYNATVKCK